MNAADSPGVTDPISSNNGLYVRAALLAKSKTLDMQGPIFHDLFSMDHYLINQVDVNMGSCIEVPPILLC